MQHNTQSSFQADCNMCIFAQNSYYTFIYVRIYIHELHKIQQKCKYLYIILYTLSTIVKSHRPTLWAPTSPPQTSAPPPANSFIPSLFNLYPHYPPTVFLIISNKIVCIPLIKMLRKILRVENTMKLACFFREVI